MVVQRRAARTGDVVWSIVTPVVMNAPVISVAAAMRVLPPLVVLEGGATIVLDVDDGSTLMTGPRFGGLQVAALGERFATWAPAGGGHVHDVDGTALFEVQGLPARLSADDGSAARARSSSTRARRCPRSTRRPARSCGARRPSSTRGCWSRTGWSCPARTATACWTPRTARWSGTSTPGTSWRGTRSPTARSSSVPATSPDGRPELSGRGLQDGVRYWSVPLPEGVRRVDAVGGHLVVRTEDDLIVYG